MRLVSYLTDQGPRAAALRGQEIVDLQQADPRLPSSLRELLAAGIAIWPRVAEAAGRGAGLPLSTVRLAPPVPDPRKIICIGLNYADHAKETGAEPPPEPVVFNKFLTALTAHEQPVALPAASSEVDYEAELVAVIGKGGRHIPRELALEHVAGYTCGNDISARDWQKNKPSKQWLLGKSFDTFAPCGPLFVTADEVGDAERLHIQLRLNGQTMQDSTTAQLIYGIAHLVSYLSQVVTLEPGDLIYTGTPPGVGMARKPPVFLKPGDLLEVEIERIGLLRNRVVAEAGPA
jgi:2-keto-4-pentenoate hydratase/2-oxohepta-3-ene-1,7-dioic acid hydratase in catechol pathway